MSFEVRGIDLARSMKLRSALYASGDTIVVEGYAPKSQYDELLGMRPLPGGRVLFLALDGAGFHGQRGRAWQTGSGNIYICAKLETRADVREEMLRSSQFVAPLAMARVAEKFVCGAVRLKWVNDLMIEDRKAGGVLTHYRRLEERHCFFWGIGLNVWEAPVCDQATTCLGAHLKQECVLGEVSGEGRFEIYLSVLSELWRGLNEGFRDYLGDWRRTEAAYRERLI